MKTIINVRNLFVVIIPVLFTLVSCSHTKVAVPIPAPVAAPVTAPASKEEAIVQDPKIFIEDMLVSKGHKRTHVRNLINDPRVDINTGLMTKNLFDSEPKGSKKNPEFMEVDPKFFKKGVEFIEANQDAFKVAWEKYQISPELITAILIIETRLGNYPMRYNVFRVYASLTTLLDTEYLDSVLQAKGKAYELNEKALKTARAKGKWGLEELSALIHLTDTLGIDPINIKGSFAGALGPAQFIPSSFVKYGVDGNNDGKKDPFDMYDCIVSVANYMKLAGWKENADLKQRRQAIWIYNHHDIYVNTVMMIYTNLIREGEKYKEEVRQPSAEPAADNGKATVPGVPDAGATAGAGEKGTPPAGIGTQSDKAVPPSEQEAVQNKPASSK